MKFAYLIIALILVSACKKEIIDVVDVPEIPYVYPNSIPAGDSTFVNLNFTNLQPDIEQGSYNSTTYNDIDIDSDGISDFQFQVTNSYPFAGTWFNGSMIRIKTLTANAEISFGPPLLAPDSSDYNYPKVYLENDSISNAANWGAGESLISFNGDVPGDGCYGPNCPNMSFGPWFGMNNQYIGIRLDGNRLGWIKVSFPSTNVDSGATITIHEYGVLD